MNDLNTIRFTGVNFSLNWKVLLIQGEDATSFLQNQTTNQVKNLNVLTFNHQCLLDVQGRIESYFLLLKKDNNNYYIVVQNELLEPTLARLEQFHISEEVEFKRSNLSLSVHTGLLSLLDHQEAYSGSLFGEEVRITLTSNTSFEADRVTLQQIDILRQSSGYPYWSQEIEKKELVNNTYLMEIAVDLKKGCFPGQETVGKIDSRRGAAYYPVLLKSLTAFEKGELIVENKKIGRVLDSFIYQDTFYTYTYIDRSHRVEGMQFRATTTTIQTAIDCTVVYFPLLKGSYQEKAKELYYNAIDLFTVNELNPAIENKLMMAIKFDPSFEDAYESLGVYLGRQKRYEEAIQLMNQLEHINPNLVMTSTNKSLYLANLGKIEEAEEEKSKATLKSFAMFGDEANKKRLEEERKKQAAADILRREKMFQQVLEIDPEDPLANYGMGDIAMLNNDYQQAIKYLNHTIKADPKYSVAYLALSKAYLKSERQDLAKKTLSEGIKISAANGDLMPANEMQRMLNEMGN